MRMTHPNKPRIPNSFAIAAGIVLMLGSVILGGPSTSNEQQAVQCDQTVCNVDIAGTERSAEQETEDARALQHAVQHASVPLGQVAESGKQAIRTQLLLLVPGR